MINWYPDKNEISLLSLFVLISLHSCSVSLYSQTSLWNHLVYLDRVIWTLTMRGIWEEDALWYFWPHLAVLKLQMNSSRMILRGGSLIFTITQPQGCNLNVCPILFSVSQCTRWEWESIAHYIQIKGLQHVIAPFFSPIYEVKSFVRLTKLNYVGNVWVKFQEMYSLCLCWFKMVVWTIFWECLRNVV